MKKFGKLLSLCLSVILVLSFGSAFADVPYELPLVTDGSVTITIATYENYATGYPYADGVPVWQKFEEDTGVTIKWDTTPSGDYNTVMSTRLAAGTDLPDFMNLPSQSKAYAYVLDGLIVDITDLIEAGSYTKQFLEENPYVRPFITAPDGRIYYFTSDVAGTSMADPYGFQVRKDWLEKLNLEEPETLDDWYEMWTAFKTMDPNGNGEADEIPFVNDNGMTGLLGFGEAFGLYTHASGGWAADSEGKVRYEYIRPEMKELLTWLNKAYSEGLIDQEWMNQTTETITRKVSNDIDGSVMRFINSIDKYNAMLKSQGIDGYYAAVKPPKKSEDSDIEPFLEQYGPVSGKYGFTKDCEDLEIKFKFIDYTYASQAGNWGTCFGVEGLSYEVVDGIPTFTDWTINNELGVNTALRSLGGMPTMPWNRSLSGYWSYQPMATIEKNEILVAAAELCFPYVVPSFPNSMVLTEDETSIMSDYSADLDTYASEMLTKFITGDASLDDFDAFVDQIKGMNLDDILSVKQAMYDRYMEAQK